MNHDVVVVGAGPVGLLLACELRLGGCGVLVLERADDPRSPLKRAPFGVRGLSIATLDAFDRRGLLDAVAAAALGGEADKVPHWMKQPRRAAGHFAGIQFFRDAIDPAGWPHRLPHQIDAGLAIEMERLEAILAARATALGVEIRCGAGVDALAPSDDGVAVEVAGETIRAGWLVGCDGGRSTIRKAAGFDFAGTDPEFTGYSAEVELGDGHGLAPGRHYTPAGIYTYSPPGTVTIADFDRGAHHRAEVTRAHLESVLRRVSGVAVSVDGLRLATTWTDRAFQATSYRRERVLLAGDAAHVHSPLGGQGLNLGLGDAVDLGWKLAAVVRGQASDTLLDSYEGERQPVAAQVLDWSRAQVALMRPSPSSRALEAIVRDLIGTPDGADYFARRVSGVGIRYDLGDDHPLVGRSAPDIVLDDGTRVAEWLRTGKAVLLDLDPSRPLAPVAARWGARLRYVAGDAVDAMGMAALLIRPDGVVGWAADSGAAVDAAAAERAIVRWIGAADTV